VEDWPSSRLIEQQRAALERKLGYDRLTGESGLREPGTAVPIRARERKLPFELSLSPWLRCVGTPRLSVCFMVLGPEA
jgi:hypothetical protein